MSQLLTIGTFTVDTGTDEVIVSGGHNLYTNRTVQFSSTLFLPGGIAASTTYFVTVTSATRFTISLILGGGPQDITTSGSGTMTVFHEISGTTNLSLLTQESPDSIQSLAWFAGPVDRSLRVLDSPDSMQSLAWFSGPVPKSLLVYSAAGSIQSPPWLNLFARQQLLTFGTTDAEMVAFLAGGSSFAAALSLDPDVVLLVRPDFAEPPVLAGGRLNRIVGLSAARRLGFFQGQKPVHSLTHRYILSGADLLEFEAFFNARRGRWQDFLMPSWTGELGCNETNLTSTPQGSPSLNIDWCDYATNYGPADGRLGRYIFILWSDGTFFTSKVNGIFSSTPGVTEELDLANPLPKDVLVTDPPVIGFLYNVRFSSDELELTYSGPGVAAFEMSYVEHVVSTPEIDV